LEWRFIQAIEMVEMGHNFEKDINEKRERQKFKAIREIKERLSLLKEQEPIQKIAVENIN
jgi:predicted nucleic acid-binding OB-fold protein